VGNQTSWTITNLIDNETYYFAVTAYDSYANESDYSNEVSTTFTDMSNMNLVYTPVTPCKIVDTRNTPQGIIDASTERDFHVYGGAGTIGSQGGNPSGCPSPLGEPLAAHINMVAVNPTGKGNLQAFPIGVEPGGGLSVNFNIIDTNLANAGTVKTTTGTGPDITVTSRFSDSHAHISVLGYYYAMP
jgi:hypothetical protein